jgi:hypothetical protein
VRHGTIASPSDYGALQRPQSSEQNSGNKKPGRRADRAFDVRFCRAAYAAQLHVSLNPIRFNDQNMQPFKVLQRPLRIQ